MNYFLTFLVGGLVILIALSAFFSFSGFSEERVRLIQPDTDFIPYHFTFDISKIREEKKFELDDIEIFSGFLFGSQDFVYQVNEENTIDMRINFNVSNGNFYLPLSIMVDDEKIVNKPLFDGSYSFLVNNITNETVIRMSTVSSTWRLWAPSLYRLEDINLEIGKFEEVEKTFLFNVTNIIDLIEGNMELSLDQNEGILAIQLNNNTVYRDAINNAKSLELKKEYFIEGINKLILRPEENSFFSGRVTMSLISVA